MLEYIDKKQETVIRAGCIPYYWDNGELRMLFMVPSDPQYGGDMPQIAKGRVEDDLIFESALREGAEELGLKYDNITRSFKVYFGTQEGQQATYEFHVWAIEIINPRDFDEPHYETGSTHWLTEQDIKTKLRPIHIVPVQNAIREIKKQRDAQLRSNV